MFEDSASGSGSVVRSERYLTPEYTPEKPIGRDTEVKRIANAVRPLVHQKSPENLLIHGPAGTGKTTCVDYVLRELAEQTRVKPVTINCWQYDTRPALLTELLIQLGYPAPRKGMTVDERLAKLREWLDKNRNVAVVLDEFDQLDEATDIVYDLYMIQQDTDHDLSHLMISNQHPSQLQFDRRSESRLTCYTLEFTPYTVEQLTEILRHRAEQAFMPGTVSDAVLEQIARRTVDENGDCRQAFNQLLRLGRKAEQRNSTEVTLDLLIGEESFPSGHLNRFAGGRGVIPQRKRIDSSENGSDSRIKSFIPNL